MKKTNAKYHRLEIEAVFQKLISAYPDLIKFYNKEIIPNQDRLAYIDISNIATFLIKKSKSNSSKEFEIFFENVEEILSNADQYIKELIVVGLFESIQNKGGPKNNYNQSFEKWLKPNSLREWKKIIVFWEQVITNKNKLNNTYSKDDSMIL